LFVLDQQELSGALGYPPQVERRVQHLDDGFNVKDLPG
jgi:hypothetical protein